MMSKIPEGFLKLKEKNPRLADAELARIGLIAELDAINLYEQMAELASDPLLKKMFLEIAYEEKEHVGEFEELLRRFDQTQITASKHGAEEVKEEADKNEN